MIMERIIGIDSKGNYLYEDNGQLDQEIQKATNEDFLNMIGEDSGDKLISLNKACEWLKKNTYSVFVKSCSLFDAVEEFVENFKQEMKGGEE